MNILKYTDFFPNRPSIFQIKKNKKIQQFVVALAENTTLEKHTTQDAATLIVLKGEIRFCLPSEEFIMKELDVFEIPIDVEHAVTGIHKENLFLITKELNSETDQDIL